MNKRQKKKNEKKYLAVIADEARLLTMTYEELENAFADYKRFREKHAFQKKYKDLKEGKVLRYYYPVGKQFANTNQEFNSVTRSENSKFVTVTQNLSDLKKSELKERF